MNNVVVGSGAQILGPVVIGTNLRLVPMLLLPNNVPDPTTTLFQLKMLVRSSVDDETFKPYDRL